MRIPLILLALAAGAASADQWRIDGKPDQSPDYLESRNGFGAMILMTTDSEQALRNWQQPTPGVDLPATDRVEKGTPIEALVLFSGCHANEQGLCNAEADYQVLKPDGSVYAEFNGLNLWRSLPALPQNQIGLAVDRVGIVAEPQDPFGTYRVRCTVRDLVADTEFVISTAFQVVEKARAEPAAPTVR